MNALIKVTAMAGLFALAACGGKGDDSLGDNVADAADNRADMMENQADMLPTEGQRDAMEEQADTVRDQGEAREEAIDESDINAAALTDAQKNAIVNGN